MELWGVDWETARTIVPQAAAAGPLVLPESLRPAIEIVELALGQFRVLGGGFAPPVPIAFDFAALDLAAGWLGHVIDRGVIGDIKALEAEILRILRDRP